jgi:eukaryotic-like serine/threonine-protein kinase
MHRRHLLRAAGLTGLGTLVALDPTPIRADEGSAVPMYRGNPARTGVMPGPSPQSAPSVRWRAHLGGTLGKSTPAVVENVVYVGSDRGLWALDAATGVAHWHFEVPEALPPRAIETSPAVIDGVVYAVSLHGVLYAVDAATGEERWRLETIEEETVASAAGQSSPAVVDGVLYLGTADGYLAAIDAATGSVTWRAPLNPGFAIEASPAVADGMVYLSYGGMRAIDAVTGEARWEGRDYVPVSTPAVVDGIVYVGMGSHVYAFDGQTGEERWQVIDSIAMGSAPAVAAGVVYLGSFGPNVSALIAATGEQLWRFVAAGESFGAAVTLADGLVYASGHNGGALYALDAETGQEQWRFDLEVPYRAVSSATVVDGVVYVHGGDDELYALA